MKRLSVLIYSTILAIMASTPAMSDFVPASKSGPPPQAAIDAAQVFADREDIQFTGMEHYGTEQTAWLSVWRFGNAHRCIDVDTATNQVASVGPTGETKLSDERLDIDEALDDVLAYLTAHKIDVSGLNMEERKCQPDMTTPDRTYNRYIFKWYGRTPEGIRLPCWIDVAIRDDGQMGIFSHIDRKVEVSLEPQVSADAAVRDALELSGYSSKAGVTDIDLFIGWTPPAHQRLMWFIGLKDDSMGSQSRYYFDARTGEKISGGKLEFGGSPPKESSSPALLAKAKQISADLTKVEILSFHPKGGKYAGLFDPHAPGVKVTAVLNAKWSPKAFAAVRASISSMARSPIDFSPLMGPSTWMRVYMPGGKDVYYCRYAAGNFGICWKENLAARAKDPKAFDLARRTRGKGMISIGAQTDAGFARLISEASDSK